VFAVVLAPAENLELLAVERMMRPSDRNPLRAAVKVLMMGIVSWFPSGRWRIGT
jgi:hypothetical protein